MLLKLLRHKYKYAQSIRQISSTANPINEGTSTVDAKELEQHVKFAQNWWDDEHGPMKPLHSMNKLRIPFIRNGLINVNKLNPDLKKTVNCFKGLKILDVGCGGGILSHPLARLGGDVVGLDASPELIECAKKYSKFNLKKTHSLEFVCSSIEDFSETNKEVFDVVVLSEIIEHVTAKDLFLKSANDVLKPGGSLFITTINQTLASWLGAIILAENILRLLPQGVHHYDKFISVEKLTQILENIGCSTIAIHGMCYIPYINRWQWTSNTSINYALHSVKNDKK